MCVQSCSHVFSVRVCVQSCGVCVCVDAGSSRIYKDSKNVVE